MRIFFLFIVLTLTTLIHSENIRVIDVDVNKSTPISRYYNFCVGAGRAHEGLRAEWQKQLAEIKKECGFRYIRFHGLLHDDMGVYKEKNGKPVYNFHYIDALYDFLLSIDVRPFVELSFMPDALKSGEETVFWWKGNKTPPSNKEKYASLIYEVVKHFVDRYGIDEVKKWYFEIWNEPNHKGFFTGTQDDYFEMYKIAATAVKKVSDKLKVGGPATAGNAWVEDMIKFCDKNTIPLDFISTHTYGLKGFFDEYGVKKLRLNSDYDCMVKDVSKVRNAMTELGKKDMELHYTEFSSSFSSHDLIHDTYQNATYILNTLRKSQDYVTSMSYWTFTDIFEEAGTVGDAFHGGFGLVNWHSIKKPTFYAYSFLNKLYKSEIQNSDKSSWITKDEKGNYAALIYDFTMPEFEKFDTNRSYFIKDRPDTSKGKIQLKLDGVRDGKYILYIYKVGYRHCDANSIYIDMGRPSQLSLQQIEALKEVSRIKPEVFSIELNNGLFELDLDWRSNMMYFIKLSVM